MISIIICSRAGILDKTLAANIDSTIGVAHEVILIDNSNNQYGICEAYNKGVAQSKYDILCCMHDDITYHTQNWGNNVLAHFNNEQVTAIGVAGTPYCAYMPGPWWGNGILYENLLQGAENAKGSKLKSNSEGIKTKQAILLDGVWFCIKKSIFSKIDFDGVNFPKFHFYDMDICMQIHQAGGKLYCIDDVLIEHSSLGAVNKTWIENAITFHNKWEKQLPATCLKLTINEMGRLDYRTLNSFILACSANNYNNKQIYKLALKYLLGFKKGYVFYKTPGYFMKFAFKYMFKKGAPFYNLNY